MDFGNTPKLAPIGPAAIIPRADIVATPGGVSVDLPPEKTVQSAQAGDAVRVDVRQREQRDLQRERTSTRLQDNRQDDRDRRAADQRAADRKDVIEQRTVIEPATRTVVLQKTNRETGETVETLPDETTLKLRLYSRISEQARLAEDLTARAIERTA